MIDAQPHALGAAEELARSTAAVASLTVLGAGLSVAAHVHDHPYLSLHVLGSYLEHGDEGEAAICGPAAAFHPAGSAHEDAIGARGLATVIVEFDAAWLRRAQGASSRLDRSRYWIGGAAGRSASRLARAWLGKIPDARRFAMTQAFLTSAANDDPPAPALPWLAQVDTAIAASPAPLATGPLADRLGVSRPWLARAYRASRGEGIGEAQRRRCVETAVALLERTGLSLAEIASEAGFCDQSHMNRAFNLLLCRTPAAVRADRLGLTGAA